MDLSFIDDVAVVLISFDLDMALCGAADAGERQCSGFIERKAVLLRRRVIFCVAVDIQDRAGRFIDLIILFIAATVKFDLIAARSGLLFDEGRVSFADPGMIQRNGTGLIQSDSGSFRCISV